MVELHYFGGMTREEIAAELGLTISTVKRALRLANAAGQDVNNVVIYEKQ